MKRYTDIEEYLSSHKPQVREDPVFLLEAQRRMRAVDGIKSEVDRQRRHGRTALVCALLSGLVAGAAGITLLRFFPAVFGVLAPWKRHGLMLLAAGCAIALGILCGTRRTHSVTRS